MAGDEYAPRFRGMGLPELVTGARQRISASRKSVPLHRQYPDYRSRQSVCKFGSDEQKEEYCENMFNGTWSGTMCLQSLMPVVRSETSSPLRPHLRHYLIKGTKQFITTGDHDMSKTSSTCSLPERERGSKGTKGSASYCSQIPKDGTPKRCTLVISKKKWGFSSPLCTFIRRKRGLSRLFAAGGK
ncbi:MAG: hypothetical protein Ct9H90mP9_3960 [Pseudomonadota bacterium]|nr:MAG: hypothetical protein Ct9H90mP9_3960 [Pseudomonadota bacterium]